MQNKMNIINLKALNDAVPFGLIRLLQQIQWIKLFGELKSTFHMHTQIFWYVSLNNL